MCIKYRKYFGIQEVLIDTLLATVELWRRVADQVHWETMVVAVKPIETLGIRFHFGFVEKELLIADGLMIKTLPPASKAVSRLSASW